MSKVTMIILFCSFILLFCGCEAKKKPIEFKLPDTFEHHKPGDVSAISPAAFVDSINSGLEMSIYFLSNFQPEETEYKVLIPGIIETSVGDLFYAPEKLPTDRRLYLVCLWGDDSKKAAERLAIDGINSYYLDGGSYRLWKEMNENGWVLQKGTKLPHP